MQTSASDNRVELTSRRVDMTRATANRVVAIERSHPRYSEFVRRKRVDVHDTHTRRPRATQPAAVDQRPPVTNLCDESSPLIVGEAAETATHSARRLQLQKTACTVRTPTVLTHQPPAFPSEVNTAKNIYKYACNGNHQHVNQPR